LSSRLLKYFVFYDQVEYYRKKLEEYRHSNPDKFNRYAAKYSKGMEQLQMYHKLLFRKPVQD
jgi:hypothetical protein